MGRFRFTIAVGVFSLGTLSGTLASPPSPSHEAVRKALRAEVHGESNERWKILKTVVASQPDNREARWQLGQLQFGKAWLDYAASADRISKSDAVRRYRVIRKDYPLTYRGQLQLANWCKTNRLPDRERAHLTAALERSPNQNDATLRNRLGFQRVNGAWVRKTDLAAQEKSQQKRNKNFQIWRARITKLARQTQSRRREVSQPAIDELKSIDDPAAIPALERILSGGGLESTELLVEILAGMRSHRAADALARIAVLSPWESVRQSASKKLRCRPIETFAPELLAAMRTPIETRMGLFVGNGRMQLVVAAGSETQSTRQLAVGRSSTILNTNRDSRGRVSRRVRNSADQAAQRAQNSQQNIATMNASITQMNNRVCAALAEGCGVVLPADPKQWWKWWQSYNQMEEEDSDDKPFQYRYYYETRIASPSVEDYQYDPPRRRSECLVAGTPIWTDRGFVAVEKLQIGDLVLARNTRTGELRYEPILRTTVRQPEPVMTVVTDRGTIRATGGHTFWVSGKGWTKLRDVKPGQYFHGVAGPCKILRLKDDGKAKTYNMVVSDLHTYFVGKGLVLSHDITFAEPVDVTVPGLPFEVSATPRQ